MRANASVWEIDSWHELCYKSGTEFRNGERSRHLGLDSCPRHRRGEQLDNLFATSRRFYGGRFTGAGSQIRFGHPLQRTTHQIVLESLMTLAATGEVADRQAQLTPFFLSQVAGRDDLDHGDRDSERGSRTPPLYTLSNA